MKKNLNVKIKFYPKVKKIISKPRKVKMSSLLDLSYFDHEMFEQETKKIKW